MSGDLWEVRTLHGGLSVELRGGESRDGMRTKPALVIVQGGDRVRVHSAGFAGCGTLRRTEQRSVRSAGAPELAALGTRFARGLADVKLT